MPASDEFGQPIEQLRRVVVENPEIGERFFRKRSRHLRHRIDEGLDTDETDIRTTGCLVTQMFAATEADLQLDGRNLNGEKRCDIRRHRLGEVEAIVLQPFGKRRGLLRANGLAAPSAEKSFGRAALAALGHGNGRQMAKASFNPLARSVFSQEKEPSRPGLRPKWP